MRNLPARSLIAALVSVLAVNAHPVAPQAATQSQPQPDGFSHGSPDQTLRFEVASVKLAAPAANSAGNLLARRVLMTTAPGRVHYVNVSLKLLMMNVYNLKDYQLIGPDSLNTIVDIDATVRPGATKEQVGVMFQNLLADRFNLTFHWDTRELPTFSIVVARNGPKMKESAEILASGSDAPPPRLEGPPKLDMDGFPILTGPLRDGASVFMINGRSQIRGQRATIEDLANQVSKTQLKYPVTDDTGLKARYDFTLKFATPEWNGSLSDIPELGILASAYEAMEPLPDLATALQSQLGLKLGAKKAPVQVLIVDHMDKAPTAN